jgi:hypothetical protein
MRYAELGSTVNYDIPYANSGAFKLEVGSSDKLTWVNDYELNDFFNPTASIAHWDHSTGNATGFTALDFFVTDADVFDPDVIQIGDSLYVIDYQVKLVSGTGFPGNGTLPADEFAVVFERFSATDPPVSNGFSEVQNNAVNADILYAKNPNIDVAINGNAAMCWEEQDITETSNHVYARTFDATNGISSIPFDLNPLSLGYKSFYNPDITSAVLDGNVPQDDHPVYITFMGSSADGLDLLVYHATYGEIRTAATPSASQLYVVGSLNTDPTLDLGNAQRDYLYRPRIASAPVLQPDLLSGGVAHQYNIVVPNLSSVQPYGTDILSFTADIPTGAFHAITTHTQTPASSIDIDCQLNFEPCTDANEEGYEVVWNADGGLWGNYGPNYPSIVNPTCLWGFYEQTILRKTIDWTGTSVYSDYSIVPFTNPCCWTHAPSVAYDHFQITGSSSGSTADHTFFGFLDGVFDQKTYYKLSHYTNISLKRGITPWAAEETSETQDALSYLGENRWQIFSGSLDDVQVRNLQGQLVQASIQGLSSSSMTVDLSMLSSGMYIVHGLQGGQCKSFKVFKP